jgi:diguanylate cyclase (GGDEF)-like protein
VRRRRDIIGDFDRIIVNSGRHEPGIVRHVDHEERPDFALYLGQPGAALASIPLVSCGMTLQPGVREQWQRHEELLAKAGQGLGQLETFDSEQLARLQIRSLMGSALAIPLLQQRHNTIGVLCLTRQDRKPFTGDQQKLAAWSVEFLAEKILVAANHAVVERQARLDGLTQLANRRTFDLQIQRELKHALATGGHCALVLLDLDRFKSINDRYGHLAGDLVLRTAAQIVRDSMGKIRACDRALCARYGGEELAVLLPGLNLNAAARVAESIRQSLEAKVIDHEGLTLRVTLSAGVADCPRKSVEMQEVLQGADCREGDEIAPRHGVSRNFFQNVIHERHRFRFGRDDRPMT